MRMRKVMFPDTPPSWKVRWVVVVVVVPKKRSWWGCKQNPTEVMKMMVEKAWQSSAEFHHWPLLTVCFQCKSPNQQRMRMLYCCTKHTKHLTSGCCCDTIQCVHVHNVLQCNVYIHVYNVNVHVLHIIHCDYLHNNSRHLTCRGWGCSTAVKEAV